MSKKMLYGEEARDKLKMGVDKLANAVIVTLGPKGRNVAIEEQFGSPTISNDGGIISKSIELEDKAENLGAQILKQSAERMNLVVGGGRTTATLLTQSLVREGLKNVTAGADPLSIKRGMEKACTIIIEKIKEKTIQVSTEEEIAQVASISAENKELGAIIAKTITEIGSDGVISIEEMKKPGYENEVVKGMQLSEGIVSPYLVTNIDKMEAILEDPFILISEKSISSSQEIIPLLEKLISSGKKEILIIAESVEGEALSILIGNKLRGIIKPVVIKTPGYGSRKKEILTDIATLTGGEVISEELGTSLSSVELSQLGRSRRIISNRTSTTIIDGKGEKEKIDSRISYLKTQIETEEAEYEVNNLKERLAKMIGGIAIIKVGAASEIELKTKVQKAQDAIAEAKAAKKEGIVPGGGLMLLRVQKELDSLLTILKDDEKIGAQIVYNILEEPIKQIAKNAGADGAVVISELKKVEDKIGYDALNNEYVDMLSMGIIDSSKVVRSCIEIALSVASTLLTTECIIIDIPEQKTCNHDRVDVHQGM